MADDIFSRLFELFNQPGPVNWKLAEEIGRHLAGEPAPTEPSTAEEIEQLVRLAEFRLEPVAPFPVAPAATISLVDARQWVSLALPRLTYLGERMADGFDTSKVALPHPGMSASIAGMQIGGLAGLIASSYPASFGSGVPLIPTGSILFIAQGVERMRDLGDAHQLRLWLSANEVAHQAIYSLPWLGDHLAGLISAHFQAMIPDPEQLMSMFEANPDSIRDPSAMAELLDRPPSPVAIELKTFFGFVAGYRQHLVARGLGELLTFNFTLEPASDTGSGLPEPSELQVEGTEFCDQIERRYGIEALDGIWDGPERLPTQNELTDPVGWAARVLLENSLDF